MNAAYREFQTNIGFCRNMTFLYRKTYSLSALADPNDISRAQVAFCGSALDRYVHERIRLGMMDIFRGIRPTTPHFDKFAASLSVVRLALVSGSDAWLDGHVRSINAFKSFQKSDKIADGIRIISGAPLWPNVAQRLAIPQSDITTQLDLVADWRNRIVHEFDVDPTLPGKRFEIRRGDVQRSLTFISRIVKAIDRTVG